MSVKKGYLSQKKKERISGDSLGRATEGDLFREDDRERLKRQ